MVKQGRERSERVQRDSTEHDGIVLYLDCSDSYTIYTCDIMTDTYPHCTSVKFLVFILYSDYVTNNHWGKLSEGTFDLYSIFQYPVNLSFF